jgi:hypothetical protein
MKKLKQTLEEPFVMPSGWLVSIEVGSGKNATELSWWFTDKMAWVKQGVQRVAFIIAGDDTFFIFRSVKGLLFGELDFSKFDRTQGVHALSFEMRMLMMLGVPREVVVQLYAATVSPAVYEEKTLDFRAKISMPVQRATGGPDTTIGNTINNAATLLMFFYNHQSPNMADLPTFQSEFGFESKYRESSSFCGVTFLKGSWFPCGEDYAWFPLPSQAIKLGKVLTNPCDVFKADAPSVAWRKMALALAKGVGEIPVSYPILGDLMSLYRRMGDESLVVLRENQNRPIVEGMVSHANLDVEFCYEFLFIRYGILKEEVEALQVTLQQDVLNFPVLLPSNPLWPKLWADYE